MATNTYADKVFKENPSGLWVLDEDLSAAVVDIPNTINLSPALNVIAADSYGLESDYGYYVENLCFNDGIPIVYGALNSTSIYPAASPNVPSLIIPGKGFMHEFGKNKNITVEFWTKIFCNSNVSEKRIFGPINSTDGLYVNDGFLTLKIANAVKSHYVGEWARPMLIAISYNSEKVSMTINGSQTILLEFDIDRTDFNTDDSDDWLGFYGHSEIPVISLDCISIYPYNLSTKQSKLHFIYGQAVEEPESKNTEINELPVVIDYEMSKTAGNHNYPDHSSWSDGYLTNLSINNKQLCSPSFEIPRVSFNNQNANEADWLYANKINNLINQDLNPSQTSTFFRLKPRNYNEDASGGPAYLSTYWTYQANFLVEDFKIGSKRADAFYLTGMADRFIASTTENIVDIVDDLNNRFSIQIVYPASGPNATIKYVYNGTVFDGTPEPNTSFTVTTSTMFSVGLNVKQFIEFVDDEDVEEFFSDPEALSVYFGGSYDYSSTFSGRVYSFGLLSSTDIQQIEGILSDSSIFSNGTLNSGILNSSVESLLTFIGGFTMKPTMTFDVFDVDASSVGYWSDIIPLKVLSKEVGEDYVIDYVQLNIDYPDFTTTTNARVRSYITFLNIDQTDTVNTDLTDSSVPANGIIHTSNWSTRRYEFVSGNIVKIPQAGSTDSELSIKIELEIVNIDISRNPLKIRRLEISSRAFDETESIGTRSGKDVDVVGIDTFARLYKRSSPYLYLSKNSGIKLIDAPQLESDYNWTGTANASTSTFTKNGIVERTNLVTNPSFETNIDGWEISYFSGGERVSSEHHIGSYSLAVSSSEGAAVVYTRANALQLNQAYSYGVYVKGSPGQQINMSVNGGRYQNIIIADGSWQLFTIENVIATIASIIIDLYCDNDFYVDNAIVEKAETFSDYFDGSLPSSIDAGLYSGSSHIKIPINESFSENYFMSAIQFAFRSGYAFESSKRYNVGKLVVASGYTYTIYMETDINSVGTLYVDNQDVDILINGKTTNKIKPYEWNIATISFPYPIDFGNLDESLETSFRLVGNFSYDNISFYPIPDQKLSQSVIYDTWSEYDTERLWNNLDGDNNLSTTALWSDVAVQDILPQGNVLVDPETVYLSYIGGLRISSDRLNNVFVFTGSKWSSYNGYNQTVSTYKPL
jgi:hypothetical protein